MARTIWIAGAVLLAGCGQGDEKSASAPAAQAAAAAAKFQPGKWRTESELVAMEVPGMPAEVAKANLGQKTNFESCMTKEQAEKPASDFFTNAKDTSCTSRDFAMAGGLIKASMTCTDKNVPGEMVMTMNGAYTPTSYNATMTMERSDGPEGATMTITARTSAKRVGECDAPADGKKQ